MKLWWCSCWWPPCVNIYASRLRFSLVGCCWSRKIFGQNSSLIFQMVWREFCVWVPSRPRNFGPFSSWQFRLWLLLLVRNSMLSGVKLTMLFWKYLTLLKINESSLFLPTGFNSRQFGCCYSPIAVLYNSPKSRFLTLSLSSLTQYIWNLSCELKNKFLHPKSSPGLSTLVSRKFRVWIFVLTVITFWACCDYFWGFRQ